VLSVMESPCEPEDEFLRAIYSLAHYGLFYSACSFGTGNQADSCHVCYLWCSSSKKVPVLSISTHVHGLRLFFRLQYVSENLPISQHYNAITLRKRSWSLDAYILVSVSLETRQFKEENGVSVNDFGS
jgi:hypothetical protein